MRPELETFAEFLAARPSSRGPGSAALEADVLALHLAPEAAAALDAAVPLG